MLQNEVDEGRADSVCWITLQLIVEKDHQEIRYVMDFWASGCVENYVVFATDMHQDVETLQKRSSLLL